VEGGDVEGEGIVALFGAERGVILIAGERVVPFRRVNQPIWFRAVRYVTEKFAFPHLGNQDI